MRSHLIFANFYLIITNSYRWMNMDKITFHLTKITKISTFCLDIVKDISFLNQKHIFNIRNALTNAL